MGAICPCLGKEPEYKYTPVPSSTSERTPLLASGSFEPAKASQSSHGAGATSARLISSRSDPPDKPFGEDDLRPLVAKETGVPNVDKQFKDHVGLFNDYLEKYNNLKAAISGIMSTYDSSGVTPGNLSQVFRMLNGVLSVDAKDSLQIARKYKYCMEMNFEAKLLDTDSLSILDGFNKANRLVKELTDKGPTLEQTVAMVVQNEEKAKRDVTVFYSEPDRKKKGPEKLKLCLKNLGEMQRVKPALKFMQKQAESIFEELKDAAQILFRSADPNA